MEHYIVVDLEMCNVISNEAKKAFPYSSEIIQIGAVLLDENLDIASEFSEYVKPKFGQLTKIIKRLTGITEQDLADALPIEEVLTHFLDWMPEGDVIAISWSMTDKFQFKKELELKNIEYGERFQKILETWVDCQPQFTEKMHMENKNYSLKEALVATDIWSEGRLHNGLVDAKNTALLYAKMQREEELVLNPYYKYAHEEHEDDHLTFSLSDALEKALKDKEERERKAKERAEKGENSGTNPGKAFKKKKKKKK